MQDLFLNLSILSRPLFPSPALGFCLLSYCLADGTLQLVGNNVLLTSHRDCLASSLLSNVACPVPISTAFLISVPVFSLADDFSKLHWNFTCLEIQYWLKSIFGLKDCLQNSIYPSVYHFKLQFLTYFSVVSLPQTFGNRTEQLK